MKEAVQHFKDVSNVPLQPTKWLVPYASGFLLKNFRQVSSML